MFMHINASKTQKTQCRRRINYVTLIAITMAKKHSKESQQKALKREAYQLIILYLNLSG
jgi:hypothetical protein